MLHLAGLLGKYRLLATKRDRDLDVVCDAVKQACGFEIPRTAVSLDERRGDVRVNVSGPKRVLLIAHKEEIARLLTERFSSVYSVL